MISLLVPKGKMIFTIGYMWCKMVCSGLLAILVVCGLLYLPNDPVEDNTKHHSGGSVKRGPRLSLKLTGNSGNGLSVCTTSRQRISGQASNDMSI